MIVLYFWIIFALLMHTLGTYVQIDGGRLYDYWIIDGLLKYDMILHFVNSFFLVLIVNQFVKVKKWLLIPIVLGLGAAYELLELISVVFFDGAVRVGDYMNNALDNLFNLIGAIVGYFYIRK